MKAKLIMLAGALVLVAVSAQARVDMSTAQDPNDNGLFKKSEGCPLMRASTAARDQNPEIHPSASVVSQEPSQIKTSEKTGL